MQLYKCVNIQTRVGMQTFVSSSIPKWCAHYRLPAIGGRRCRVPMCDGFPEIYI